MGQLAETIRKLIQEERYLIGEHATERLSERSIMEWQAVDATICGDVVAERPSAYPNPVVEFVGLLPDGTEVKIVWAYLQRSAAAKLVTVFYLD